MSSFEEKKYKKILIDETPDLWDKIDSKLTDEMYEVDTAPDMDMSVKADASPRVKAKKHIRIYKTAGLIAAALAVIAIPLAIRNTKKMAMTDMAQNNESAIMKSHSDNELYSSDSITSQEDTENDTDSFNAFDSITNNSSDKKGVTSDENSSAVTPDNSVIEQEDAITEPGDTPTNKGDNNMKSTVTFKITDTPYTDNIGLIYAGVVTSTYINEIKSGSTIYVSLRYLSRTELGIKHKIGDELCITLKDTSYVSSPDKPYYASSIIR